MLNLFSPQTGHFSPHFQKVLKKKKGLATRLSCFIWTLSNNLFCFSAPFFILELDWQQWPHEHPEHLSIIWAKYRGCPCHKESGSFSHTKLFVAVITVKRFNGIYRKKQCELCFLFVQEIESVVELILQFQDSGSIFFSILKLGSTQDVIILKAVSF